MYSYLNQKPLNEPWKCVIKMCLCFKEITKSLWPKNTHLMKMFLFSHFNINIFWIDNRRRKQKESVAIIIMWTPPICYVAVMTTVAIIISFEGFFSEKFLNNLNCGRKLNLKPPWLPKRMKHFTINLYIIMSWFWQPQTSTK